MKQTEYENGVPLSEFYKTLGDLEERLNLQYAESQKEAIRTALFSPIMALTGGPGTGKTTVIKGIVEIYAEIHGLSLKLRDYNSKNPFPILLVAPTGRAAKRMNESTGLPSVTIHRLLGWQGELGFEKDENHPVEGRLLIINVAIKKGIEIAKMASNTGRQIGSNFKKTYPHKKSNNTIAIRSNQFSVHCFFMTSPQLDFLILCWQS